MSAEKLGGQTNNRAHTPARFVTFNSEHGKVVLNITFITNIHPIPKDGIEGEIEGKSGIFRSTVHLVSGQMIRIKEDTSVVAQVLSADGLHGSSR